MLFQFVELLLLLLKLVSLLLEDYSLLFVLQLESIVPDHEPSVLLGPQFAISADASICLFLVFTELLDSTFHLLETLVELFDLVSVALLALVAVGHVALDVVLIEFHQARYVLIFILSVDDLLHVLLELRDDLLFSLRLIILSRDFDSNLSDLAFHLAQVIGMRLQIGTLLLEIFLKLKQLILQIVDLLLFRLETGLHLFGAMRQDVL